MEDTPAFLSCPGEALALRYDEGVFCGHRWYDARDIAPRFPFRHGLSYARFAYGELRVARDTVAAGEPVEAEIEIANEGERPGVEVVQLYLAAPPGPVRRPPRVLAGFAKLRLAPGERGVARFTVSPRSLSFWDAGAGAWRLEPGGYELLAGRSSRDLRARARFAVVCAASDHGARASARTRKSTSACTRTGCRPPGGATRCSATGAICQSGRTSSSAPLASSRHTTKSGCSAMPRPASRAGVSASPLLALSGPAGRTTTSSPAAFVKRHRWGVGRYAYPRQACSASSAGWRGRPRRAR
jgi:hypothetical protein